MSRVDVSQKADHGRVGFPRQTDLLALLLLEVREEHFAEDRGVQCQEGLVDVQRLVLHHQRDVRQLVLLLENLSLRGRHLLCK